MKYLLIKRSQLKDSIRKALNEYGLYHLETVLRKESCSHGVGCGGEDIGFEHFGQTVQISDNGRRIRLDAYCTARCSDGKDTWEEEWEADLDPRVVKSLRNHLCKVRVHA